MINKFLEWLNSKPKENAETVSLSAKDIDYDSLSTSSLILLLKSRDSEIANYEQLLRTLSVDSGIDSPVSDSEVREEKEELDKETVLNKINRSNYRTIGVILSNRSRDRDRYKFRPLNKAK